MTRSSEEMIGVAMFGDGSESIKNADLKPCPFCGNEEIEPEGVIGKDAFGHITKAPQCMGCGATAESVEAWNVRTDAAEAKLEELERQIPRFPDHMAKIVEAKNAGLPERVEALVAALEVIPEYMRQYQWQADKKQAFGSKWVRTICGDNGRGMGRQAIAEVVGHIDVADFIAAANPDTVSLMLGELTALKAQIAGLTKERDDALHFLDVAVSKSPESLKALGSHLANLLDEDDWPTAERFLNGAATEAARLRIKVARLRMAMERAERITRNGQPDKIADAADVLRSALEG